MTEHPDWLLIGAAGRNAGKTALACALIARHQPIAAVKVTVVQPGIRECPRGGEGCGVCSSLGKTPFWLRTETNPEGPKDTSSLLAAGASPVLWLCTRADALPEAIAAILPRIPPSRPVIAESNSLRHHLIPSLFLMVRHTDDPSTKPSATSVLPHVDRTVRSDGAEFDLDLDDVVFEDGVWRLI